MVSPPYAQQKVLDEYVLRDVTPSIDERHIVFINSSMVCGGAERVITLLTEYWAGMGTRTTVVTIHSPDRDHYSLDPRVGRVSLDAKRESKNFLDGFGNNLRRVAKLRRAIRSLRPSVVISFQDTNNVLTLIASAGLSVPTIVCERNDPRMKAKSPIWAGLRRLVYRRANMLVVQTQSLVEWARKLVGADKVYVLPNPVAQPAVTAISPTERQETIVAVGRLVRQKGFDMLLEAISLCDHRWVLEIVGDGPERRNLELLARTLGISDQVRFVGRVTNPGVHYQKAALFVLSSRYEGFPNVLVEAMACGLPAISFDCASGPAEIIRHGVDGILVPPEDAHALARAIDTLMMNPRQRLSMAKRAHEVVHRFATAKIVSEWDSLIQYVSRCYG